MIILQSVLIVIVALLHLGFLYLEMFLWQKPEGLKIFRNSLEVAKSSAVLAANQGLYNGFLSAGLMTSFFLSSKESELSFQVFFLACVIVAGIYGAITVSRRIFYVQSLPAIFALAVVLWNFKT
jgi:putative membrane protein